MEDETVQTRSGKVQGIEKDGYTLFAGIPYAVPPTGDNRFREPQPVRNWDGILQADHFPKRSIQGTQDAFYTKEFYSDPFYETQQSEDCLYLNIWTPAKHTEEKLPVAFWIHGGAFLNGYGHEMEFDGAEYCRRGVILITINYRLGAFGFLCHPLLAQESAHGSSGNYGILDQICALNWVYDNIAAFGGDPERITVFGQSAGCMSVHALVSSALTKNRIHSAIFQSGSGYHDRFIRGLRQKDGEYLGKKFTDLCGAESAEDLRSLTVEEICTATGKLLAACPTLPFMPVIDGYVLTEDYDELAQEGMVKDIPYLLGTTRNDLLVTKKMLQENTHSVLYQGCINWAQLMEQNPHYHHPAYVYYFNRCLPGDDAGAFHSSELWYMFGTTERCWRPLTEYDRRLSDRMLEAWTGFMKTGDPGWQSCGTANPYVEVLE
ncbi:MAG: carboxylesterase family protein [Butyrivibrio sp.]|jgi:para-nitrobenzyl esterase|nr:carboxylesterase family protein [Butyrivibrio sp.]